MIRLCYFSVCASLLTLLRQGLCQDTNGTLVLADAQLLSQPVLVAPLVNGSLNIVSSAAYNDVTKDRNRFKEEAGSYQIDRSGEQLTALRSQNFSVGPSNVTVLPGFTRVSCATVDLTGSAGNLYAFITASTYFANTTAASGISPSVLKQAAAGLQRSFLVKGSNSLTVLAEAIPNNVSAAQELAIPGLNATARSGPQQIKTVFTDTLSLVIVNSSPNEQAATVALGMNPAGPCQLCDKVYNAKDNRLGNCSANQLAKSYYTFQNPTSLSSDPQDAIAATGQPDIGLSQGESALLAVFTNTACMLYTLSVFIAPPGFNINYANITTWINTEAEQNSILERGAADGSMRQRLRCEYPVSQIMTQPCFGISLALDPSETYYWWAEVVNGGDTSGDIGFATELFILQDQADCASTDLYNLSATQLYLYTSPAVPGPQNGVLRTLPPPAPLAANYLNNSKNMYDPGLAETYNPDSENQGSVFSIITFSPSGGYYKTGSWSYSNIVTNATASFNVVNATVAGRDNKTLLLNNTLIGRAFTNAACLTVDFDASAPVNTYLVTYQEYWANNKISVLNTTASIYSSPVTGSSVFRVTSADYIVKDLSVSETYIFLVSEAVQNNTQVSSLVVAYPAESPVCQTGSVSPTSMTAPAPAPLAPLQMSKAVRSVYYFDLTNLSGGQGAATPAGTVTGVSCFAFAITPRTGSTTVLPDFNANVYTPGEPANVNFSASAIFLDSRSHQKFSREGFSSDVPLPVLAGCLLNETSPGPCSAYADGLDPSQIYYLWALDGTWLRTSPSTRQWFLTSFVGLPTGSCSQAFPMLPTAPAPVPAPGPGPTLFPPPTVQNTIGTKHESLSGGVIGGITAGGAAAAACLLAVVLLWTKTWRPFSGLSVGKHKPVKLPSSPFLHTDEDVSTKDFATFDEAINSNYRHRQRSSASNSLKSTSSRSDATFATYTIPTSAESAAKASLPYQSSESKSIAGIPDSNEATVVNFAEAQERFNLVPAVLPLPSGPSKGRIQHADQGIVRVAESAGPLEDVDLKDYQLHDTWKVDSADLKCRLKGDSPVVLGEGGFGKVMLGLYQGVQDVAIKVVRSHTAAQQASFTREIMTLRACYSPHIVQFIGASIRQDQTLLVMEYMAGGDLWTRLACDTEKEYGWFGKGQPIALDIAKGLSYLHSKSIAHLDMKSLNILLTDTGKAKIADVGLGKLIAGPYATTSSSQGSPWWASPEQLMGDECSVQSDIFSMGTILWEIVTTEQPRNRILRPLEEAEAPNAIIDIIKRCHALIPEQRPTAQEVHNAIRSSRMR